jgi:BolA protein
MARMNVQTRIETMLGTGIPGVRHLEVVNESGRHSVPPGSESHFKVTVVSDSFHGVGLLARHRLINGLLADELANRIHALAIHAYTSEEWRAKMGNAPMSPPCLGGGKADVDQ